MICRATFGSSDDKRFFDLSDDSRRHFIRIEIECESSLAILFGHRVYLCDTLFKIEHLPRKKKMFSEMSPNKPKF